jgi:hypothetical protein
MFTSLFSGSRARSPRRPVGRAANSFGVEGLECRLLMTNDKTLSGFVYCDADNDGVKDAGEKGIAGVVITVTGTDRLGAVRRTTTTNGDGFYKFEQLNPGTYKLTETQPSGAADGKDTLGRLFDAVTGAQVGSRGTAGNDMFSDIRIPAGNPVIGRDYNFGEICEKLGKEGLSPGFWKNHTSEWVGLSPGQTLESVFDIPDSLGLDNKTLLQALKFGGGRGVKGAAQNLCRQAVAALLNAKHPDVDYALSSSTIISRVNSALASGSRTTIERLKNELDRYNNAHGGSHWHGHRV